MVHILNGEIVQDDDPRLLKKRSQPQQQQRRSTSSSSNQRAPLPGQRVSPLDEFARKVGLEGIVTIPAISTLLPERQVKKAHLAIFALMVLFMGWRGLVFGAIIYVLTSFEGRN